MLEPANAARLKLVLFEGDTGPPLVRSPFNEAEVGHLRKMLDERKVHLCYRQHSDGLTTYLYWGLRLINEDEAVDPAIEGAYQAWVWYGTLNHHLVATEELNLIKRAHIVQEQEPKLQ